MAIGSKLTAKKTRDYKKIYIEALEKFNGVENITQTYLSNIDDGFGGSKYNISWSYYTRIWKADDVVFKSRIDLVKQNITEWVEGKLFEQINNGHYNSIKLYLERKGGWIETTKQEIENNINIKPVKIEITKPNGKSNK